MENLGKRYRRGGEPSLLSRARSFFRPQPDNDLWALRGASFEVPTGETLAVLGLNGAGKSTLLNLLARITAPTEGRARLRGRVASLLSVGTGFNPELTGRENVFLYGAMLGMSRTEIRRRFDEIVAFSGVEAFLDTAVKFYSSGMYMRLGFSVAAHLEPEILILDEVLAVGDWMFSSQCLQRIRRLTQEGRTVMLVTHNSSAIRDLCQRSLILEQGRLVYDGPTSGALERYEGQKPDATEPIADESSCLARTELQDKSSPPPFRVWRIALRGKHRDPRCLFHPYEPVLVEIDFRLKQPIHELCVEVSLAQSSEGVLLLKTHHTLSQLAPGDHRARVRFPSQFFGPVQLWLSVRLHASDVGEVAVVRVLQLTVALPDESTKKLRGALLEPLLEWDYEARPPSPEGASLSPS